MLPKDAKSPLLDVQLFLALNQDNFSLNFTKHRLSLTKAKRPVPFVQASEDKMPQFNYAAAG